MCVVGGGETFFTVVVYTYGSSPAIQRKEKNDFPVDLWKHQPLNINRGQKNETIHPQDD